MDKEINQLAVKLSELAEKIYLQNTTLRQRECIMRAVEVLIPGARGGENKRNNKDVSR